MKKTILITLVFISIGIPLLAQSGKNQIMDVHIQPIFDEKELILEQEGYQFNENPIEFEMLRFYLSDFAMLDENQVVWQAKNSHHLLDASQPNSMNISLEIPVGLEYDKITFNLGIDSTTNVSGAMGGDLDPTKGMYWSWNSGYVNFKLEGISNLCPTRNHAFQFHMGGYMAPFETVQAVQLEVDPSEKLTIAMDISQFLQKLDLTQQHTIMSPGVKAQELSKIAATIFTTDE